MAPGIVNIQLDQSIIKLFIFSIPLIKLKISTLCGVMYGYGMNYIVKLLAMALTNGP